MPSPPSFSDLGKSTRDLFGKGFHHGFLKFDSTTTNPGKNVEFKTGLSHNLSNQRLAGNVEVKYKIPQYNSTLTEKWNTDNNLGTTLEVQDQFMKGNKVTLDLTYNPHAGRRNAMLKTQWISELVKINADANLVAGPVFNLSGVGFFQPNWYIGGLVKFDLATRQLRTHSLAIGHQTPEYTLHSYVNDGREFGASIYHQVSKNVELGTQLSWVLGNPHVNFGIASKYKLNKELTIQSKVDNNSNIAISATHDIGEALKVTLSTHFGLANAGPQTFGLGLEYKPCCCHH